MERRKVGMLSSKTEVELAERVLDSLGKDGMDALQKAMHGAETGRDYSTVFTDVFDEWCDWLEERYYERHPKRSEMPDSFYECQCTWAKKNKEPSFELYLCANLESVIGRVVAVYNNGLPRLSRPATAADLLAAYVAGNSRELTCRALADAFCRRGRKCS